MLLGFYYYLLFIVIRNTEFINEIQIFSFLLKSILQSKFDV